MLKSVYFGKAAVKTKALARLLHPRVVCSVGIILSNKSTLFSVPTTSSQRIVPNISSHNVPTRYYCSGNNLPKHYKVSLPALSPTMEHGTLVRWTKQEGDSLSEGDLLAEIETDKATMGFETPEEGFLAKILIPAGTKDVPIGKLMCIIVTSKESIEAFKNYKPTDAEKSAGTQSKGATKTTPPPSAMPSTGTATLSASPATPSATIALASAKAYPPHNAVKLPALSPTMEKGNIAAWLKKVGDELKEGDLLCQIETDKAVMDLEATDAGFLAYIAAPAGSKDVPLGKLLCIIVDKKENVAAFKDYKAPTETQSAPRPEPPKAGAKSPAPPASPPVTSKTKPQSQVSPKDTNALKKATPGAVASGGIVAATPLARKLASEKGIDLKLIKGSGPQGEVKAEDVLAFKPAQRGTQPSPTVVAAQAVAPLAPGATYVDIPLSNMRQVIAKRLVESKNTIPHYYLTVEIDMGKVGRLRKELNAYLEKENVKLSVNDFIIKAASLACIKVPQANSSWQQQFIRQYNRVDMCVAVATANGLITPIVFGADKKGLATISQDVKLLAEKARNNKLQPQEYQGGTFTVSNLGMFGIKHFTAIINPPQACILAIGGTEKRLIPSADTSNGYRVVDTVTVTLSCDHRVVDGAVGAQWLGEFKKLLEKPETMLL